MGFRGIAGIAGVAAGTALAVVWFQVAQAAGEIEEGQRSFARYCAACHGADGTGNGPLAAELRTRPADLTRIRARNAGRFPYSKVRETIDGRRETSVHGPRDMPVWGKRFAEAAGGGTGSEIRVDAEITALLAYIDSIQRQAEPER